MIVKNERYLSENPGNHCIETIAKSIPAREHGIDRRIIENEVLAHVREKYAGKNTDIVLVSEAGHILTYAVFEKETR